MKEKVRIGYIGLGRRGFGMLKDIFADMNDVEITAVCDLREQKMAEASAMLQEKGRPAPAMYADYKEMLRSTELDAVAIMSGWNGRIQMAIDCMETVKYVTIEVGCAYDVSECFRLVDAAERTGSHVMMLENCCYGRREMAALKMAAEGLFGKIVVCSGGYHHDLRTEDLLIRNEDGTYETNHYRMAEYVNRNCEQYPTHELGPIAKVLKINRGNRILSLRSIANNTHSLADFTRDNLPQEHPYYNSRVAQADYVTTFMDCANGEQIILTLDTTLPRSHYSRKFTVRGTKGMCEEAVGHVCTYHLDGMKRGREMFNNEEEWLKEHDHPLHAEYLSQTRGGHGGMDWLVTRAFVESVKRGIVPPIDTYDTAVMLAVAPLSEASIAAGGAAVQFPDFTKGAWFRREPEQPWKYSLDSVCAEPETPIVP